MKTTEIRVRENYLVLPVGESVSLRKVTVRKNGLLIDDFDLRLDYVNPHAYFFYDLRPYHDQVLEFGCTPDVKIQDRQTVKANTDRDLKYRPFLHFTANRGWINDPNGLVEYTSPVTGEKAYHMFYQYNPYDTIWGNMHWGHAISHDLLHWNELPVALSPDESGTMFSGSAIIDRKNLTGLKSGDEDVILFYYTAAGNTSLRSEGREFTQCLAYSADGGKTFRKYENNPVLPHIEASNRDPKIIYCEELNCYVMALYLNGANFALFASEDLLHWNKIQEITIEGDEECPDLFPLNVDGDPKKRKWVLIGASGIYLVCEYKNGKFEQIQAPRKLCYGDRHHYAAQTFSDVSDGRRISIGWNRNLRFPHATFMGQMSFPLELSLRSRDKEIDLCAKPITEIRKLKEENRVFRNIEISQSQPVTFSLSTAAYLICIDFCNILSDCEITLFGQSILIDNKLNKIVVGDDHFPFLTDKNNRTLTIIVDSSSAELFSGNGEAMMTVPLLCDYNINELTLSSSSSVRLSSIEISRLSDTTR